MKHVMDNLIFLFVLFCFADLNAQSNHVMTPDVYNEWRKIKNIKLSDSAQTIIYTLEREVGDKQLAVYSKKTNQTHILDRVKDASVDYTGDYIVYTHSLANDSLRTLKRKKTAKDKLPADSLTIFHLPTERRTVIDQISGYTLAAKYPDILIYNRTIKKEMAKDTSKINSPCKDQTIIIRQLSTGSEDTLRNVKDYLLADDAPAIAYTQCTGDTTLGYILYRYDIKSRTKTPITAPYYEITNLTFDKKGDQMSYLTLDAKSVLTKKPYTLYYQRKGDISPTKIMEPSSISKPKEWMVSSDAKMKFSESGNRLMFGLSPPAIEKDTTKLDDEIVNVEIWHHNSPRIYTQDETTVEEDRKRSYQCVYDVRTRQITQVESEVFPRSSIAQKGDGIHALLQSTLPYQKEVTWVGESRKDISLKNLITGIIDSIVAGTTDFASFSPKGTYLYWYDKRDTTWYYFNTTTNQKGIIAKNNLSLWAQELHDTPNLPDNYGFAGWLDDDQAILIYDRYDIWQVNPRDTLMSIALTNGRKDKKIYRYVDIDVEREGIDPNRKLLLHVHDETTKSDGYAYLDIKTGKIQEIMSCKCNLAKNMTKARSTENLIYTRQSFIEFPDLTLTDTSFSSSLKFSEANPQQKNYAWGTNQLFSWKDKEDSQVNGMLFLPPDFDKSKKYPLIVNFYERSSQDLYRHRAPEAHRSQINYTYYTNHGYVIFNPDIAYTTTQPGDDCMNAVESGVSALIAKGFIDTTRMALQGHSWGGYQIAYMLTKTHRYRCAEAGAAVVNMVSAYGGVRWETGMSRIFQYEKTQSRIGKSLWENPNAYHRNSPIYQLDKVTTPVLIMHNDEDGAVPWEQGIEYYMAMRRLGKPAWLLNYNGEPHWPVKWQNRLDFNIRLEQFFDHFLMGEPMPLWMKEGNTPLEKGIMNKY